MPKGFFALALSLITLGCLTASAQETAPQLVEIFVQKSKTVPLAEVTKVLILDDSISSARVSPGGVEFFGLARGETVAFAWVNQQRISLRIKVTARPAEVLSATLARGGTDALGNGMFSSSMQTFTGANGGANFFLVHHLEWRQEKNGNRFIVRGQAQDTTVSGAPSFNMNSISLSYENSRTRLSLMDFPLEINGGIEAGGITSYAAHNVYTVRGAEVALRNGSTEMGVFGGATIPPYYRTLRSTRDIAGFNFRRKQSNLYTYATTGWVNSPILGSELPQRRASSFFQTAGFSYKPTVQWAVEGMGGGSTRGGLAQGAVSYTQEHLTAFLTGTRSSASFPLNQLQLFSAGGSSASAGATVRMNSRLAASVYSQHSSTKSPSLLQARGASDYFSSNLSFSVTSGQSVSLNYAKSRNRSAEIQHGNSQTQRFDVSLNSRIVKRISNTAQVTFGRTNDPLQVNSQGDLTVREALNLPIPAGSITIGLQRTSRDPSLVKRLNDQLDLLPPELQQLFLQDSAAFAQSSNLPPDLRAMLENLRPTDTEITLSGQFHIGRRVNLSPNAGYSRDSPGANRRSGSHHLGYSLSYQVTPTLQLVSSLSKGFVFQSQGRGLQQTTVMTVGFNKRFSGAPHWLAPSHKQRGTIRGRVFVDRDVNGGFNTGETGMAGVRVELDKEKTAVTDSEGRFEFSGLRPNTYRVRVPLDQFNEAVRLTGPADVRASLPEDGAAEINFGVVNFARLTGSVFNDYLLDGKKQPDANGLPHVRLLLAGNGVSRELVTDGAGDYGVSDIAPGDYQFTVDRMTLPSNFLGPEAPIVIHVAPVSTVVRDIPIRAIRSVSGRVLFGAALQPVAGVQLKVDRAIATTDAEGRFVLRNLPAGELMLSVIPIRSLPAGLNAPAGKVTLRREPVDLDNVTIVISNPDLLPYLAAPVAEATKP